MTEQIRDPFTMALFAAWVNTTTDKVPAEYQAHTCEATMKAWKRVADAAEAYLATRTPPGESEFKPGDRVLKVEGYPFGTGDAVVLSVYRCASGTGPWRYVVEHPEGWQHIFSGKQLALASPTDRT